MNKIMNPFRKIRNLLICFYKMIANTVEDILFFKIKLWLICIKGIRNATHVFKIHKMRFLKFYFDTYYLRIYKYFPSILMKIKTLRIQAFILKIVYIISNLNNHLCFSSTLVESSW